MQRALSDELPVRRMCSCACDLYLYEPFLHTCLFVDTSTLYSFLFYLLLHGHVN